MKQTLYFAVIAAAIPLFGQSALADQGGLATPGYVGDGRSSQVVTNSAGQCLHTSSWGQNLAVEQCDPSLMPKKVAEAAPAPRSAPRPAPVIVAKAAPVIERVTLKAGALFDVGKADLKGQGKSELDALVRKIQANNTQIQQITVTGHTDATGASEYNRKLSERRAETVKAYLVSQGLSTVRIVTQGVGEAQPVASNKTAAGRAQNRRVEIDIRGQQTTTPAN